MSCKPNVFFRWFDGSIFLAGRLLFESSLLSSHSARSTSVSAVTSVSDVYSLLGMFYLVQAEMLSVKQLLVIIPLEARAWPRESVSLLRRIGRLLTTRFHPAEGKVPSQRVPLSDDLSRGSQRLFSIKRILRGPLV